MNPNLHIENEKQIPYLFIHPDRGDYVKRLFQGMEIQRTGHSF